MPEEDTLRADGPDGASALNPKRRKTVLLTGATGLIGRHILGALLRDAAVPRVVATYRSRKPAVSSESLELVRCALEESSAAPLAGRRFDAVIHAAAFLPPASVDPAACAEEIFSTNILGTIRLFDSIRLDENAKIVYLSSASVYNAKKGLFREDDAVGKPHVGGLYAVSKSFCEWYLGSRFKRLSILRPSYTYGVGMDGNKLIPRLLSQCMKGLTLDIRPPFDGRCDYVHAADVAGAVVHVLRRTSSGVFNVGSGSPLSMGALARRCIEAAGGGRMPPVKTAERTGGRDQLLVDISRIEHAVGWTPRVSIDEGLDELLLNTRMENGR